MKYSFLFAASLLATLLAATAAHAQWLPTWTPGATPIYAIAPLNGAVFAAGDRAMFRSTDTGATWQTRSGTAASGTIRQLVSAGGRLFSLGWVSVSAIDSTGFDSQSSDSGFLPIVRGENDPYRGPLTLRLAVLNDTLFAAAWDDVYRSVDLGASWQQMNTGMDSMIIDVAVCSNTVFALNSKGAFRRSQDGGDSWDSVPLPVPHGVIADQLLATDRILLARTAAGLYRTSDRGNSWSRCDTIQFPGSMAFNAIIDHRGTIMLGSSNSGLFLSGDAGIHWQRDMTFAPARVLALASIQGTAYAGVDSGVLVLGGFAQAWHVSDRGFAAADCNGFCVRDSTLFAGTGGNTIYVSHDSGLHWSIPLNANLPKGWGPVKLAGLNRDRLYILNGGQVGLYYSTNEGASWTMGIDTMFEKSRGVTCFAHEGDTLYAGSERNGFYRSTDRGISWQRANSGYPTGNYEEYGKVRSLFAVGGRLVAVTEDSGLYRSSNHATTWSPLAARLPNATRGNYTQDGNTLYAVCWTGNPSQGTNDTIYFSTDAGSSWRATRGDGLDHGINALAVRGTIMIAATWTGMHLSLNQGDTWRPCSDGLLNGDASAVAIFGNYLFADVHGLLRRPLADTLTAVEKPHLEIPESPITISNYPNPFSQRTTIRVHGGGVTPMTLMITDMLGRVMYTDTKVEPNTELDINAGILPNGMYVCRIQTPHGSARGTLVVAH